MKGVYETMQNGRPFWACSPEEVLRDLRAVPEGWSTGEAEQRQVVSASARLKPQPDSQPFRLLLAQFRSPTTAGPGADGIAANRPGQITSPLIQKYVDDVLLVSEREIIGAMAHLFAEEKLVVEPAGALTISALRRYGSLGRPDGNVVAVLSGGNVEPQRFAELLQSVR